MDSFLADLVHDSVHRTPEADLNRILFSGGDGRPTVEPSLTSLVESLKIMAQPFAFDSTSRISQVSHRRQ